MRLLLDTHVLLWAVEQPAILDEKARQEIGSDKNFVYVSIASLWELEIKRSMGKLDLPKEFYQRLPGFGFESLPITLNHVQAIGALPFHHRDPFDRMLIAQARSEQLLLVTRDDDIKKYDVSILWA